MENNATEREIVNRVATSSLITLDLEDYYHAGERIVFDVAPMLYKGLILKEKEFRQLLKEINWSIYQDKNVAITCTAEAIIPVWAYMLVALHMQPYVNTLVFGNSEDLENRLFNDALGQVNGEDFKDAKVVIKGCSKHPVPTYAYVEIARKLKPYVASLMYGEACSTVPLYKRPKSA